MKTKYIKLNNAKIAYSKHNSSPDLLLLHGNLQDKKIYKKHQLKHFKNFHTFAIDSRDFGKSISYNNDKLSIDQYSNDIIDFCKQLHIKNVRCRI